MEENPNDGTIDHQPSAIDQQPATSNPAPSPIPHLPSPDQQTQADVLRRIKRTALAAAAIFAVFSGISGGFRAFLGLTCSAAVTMISFLWLEEILGMLLQPAAHLHARRLTLRSLARIALLGVALTVTIIVARFNAVSVLLGFSIIVVGICGEALYAAYRSLVER